MFRKLRIWFVLIPLAELVAFVAIGSRIGLGATFVITLATGLLGAWLVRSQGIRSLDKFRKATAEGRLPHGELIDGLMILIAGVLLLIPGFLTDLLGLVALVPAVRSGFRQTLAKRIVPVGMNFGSPPAASSSEARPRGTDDVIDV